MTGQLIADGAGQATANAAWLAITAITCNLLRAAGTLASRRHAKARAATILRDLITVAARIAPTAGTASPSTIPKAGTANATG